MHSRSILHCTIWCVTKNTPANLSPYLLPTKIASEHVLLNADNTPDVAAIQAFAAQCAPGDLATLDLETWPYTCRKIVQNKLITF